MCGLPLPGDVSNWCALGARAHRELLPAQEGPVGPDHVTHSALHQRLQSHPEDQRARSRGHAPGEGVHQASGDTEGGAAGACVPVQQHVPTDATPLHAGQVRPDAEAMPGKVLYQAEALQCAGRVPDVCVDGTRGQVWRDLCPVQSELVEHKRSANGAIRPGRGTDSDCQQVPRLRETESVRHYRIWHNHGRRFNAHHDPVRDDRGGAGGEL